jgi:hypothetical protein
MADQQLAIACNIGIKAGIDAATELAHVEPLFLTPAGSHMPAAVLAGVVPVPAKRSPTIPMPPMFPFSKKSIVALFTTPHPGFPMATDKDLSPETPLAPAPVSTPNPPPPVADLVDPILTSDNTYSVFDVLNIFRAQWFLSQNSIIKNIMSAQKDSNGTFTWVKFAPQYHSYLIWSDLQLIPHNPLLPHPPVGCFKLVKKVLFIFILEVLSKKPCEGFFQPCSNPHKAEKNKCRQQA